ncbi:hypothetical protein L336_0230 [Candidatus Saccharimonas aalborgensis]|uniref:Uncharacterized protein n=1 Tax=Candidatus Saccharimonas aalborgensis TaxID=1332188 RepID=R4PM46_9BACT|nr:hypothetical protein L336_0230 [Candidatus Saccharimonas aalborgensis]
MAEVAPAVTTSHFCTLHTVTSVVGELNTAWQRIVETRPATARVEFVI